MTSLRDLARRLENLPFEARYYGAWVFFLPAFVTRLLYYVPAFVFGAAPVSAAGSFLVLNRQRLRYLAMEYALGIGDRDPALQLQLAEARRRCRRNIQEIDEAFAVLYE